MTGKELERLSSWLRCYPVAGREDERKALTEIVENDLVSTVQRERSDRIRAGLSLDGLVQIPEWMLTAVKCSRCGRFEQAHPTPECPQFYLNTIDALARKPVSLEELEQILKQNDSPDVAINLDGTISVAEASDNCRPDGAPILCGAEYISDPTDRFSETQHCILAQGHVPVVHKTRTGKLFVGNRTEVPGDYPTYNDLRFK